MAPRANAAKVRTAARRYARNHAPKKIRISRTRILYFADKFTPAAPNTV